MTAQNDEKHTIDERAEEEKVQEVIDGVTKKRKKKTKKLKPDKDMIKKVFKEYQFQFLITIIAIVVIIVLLTISYKTNPYINNQEDVSVAYSLKIGRAHV